MLDRCLLGLGLVGRRRFAFGGDKNTMVSHGRHCERWLLLYSISCTVYPVCIGTVVSVVQLQMTNEHRCQWLQSDVLMLFGRALGPLFWTWSRHGT